MKPSVFILSITILTSVALSEEEKTFSRIITDFNLDGFSDIALSGPNSCGNAGCWWNIYMGNGDGSFQKEATTLFFHPLAINIRNEENEPTITVYHRSGGGEGSLIEYVFRENEFKKLSNRIIFPDDSGGDEDRSLYEALFGGLRNNRMDEKISEEDCLKQIERIKANQTVLTTPEAALPTS